jgi:hypothetical protein
MTTFKGLQLTIIIYRVILLITSLPTFRENIHIESIESSITSATKTWYELYPTLSWRSVAAISLRRQSCHDYIKTSSGKMVTLKHQTEPSPIGRHSSEPSPIGRHSSEPSPIGRHSSEPSPIGRHSSEPSPIKYPCAICNKPVAKNQHALQCDECDAWPWVHTKCDGISKEDYKCFETIHSLVFECPSSRLLTFTDSFFISDHEQSYESNKLISHVI